MPAFYYIAKERSGARAEGRIEAANRRAALAAVERLGLLPVSISDRAPESSGAPVSAIRGGWRAPERRAPRMKERELTLFLRELSDLLASGMTLGQALGSLSNRQIPPGPKSVLEDLRRRVNQGEALSAACAEHPRTFSSLVINLLRAGEASGQMSEVLERICSYQDMVHATREKVVMALVYPMIVLILGLVMMLFALTFVVPKFTAVLTSLGSVLPVPTRLMVWVSRALLRYGWAIAIAITVGIGAFRRLIRTPAGRLRWDRFRLQVPVIRDMIRAHAFAQFARTLGSLLSNGVPILDALRIVEATVGNVVIAGEIREARERVTDGSTISGPLAKGRVFPPLLTDMLAVGEQSGDMPTALSHIARRYESELDRHIKLFTVVLEPVLMLLIAVLIGFVALGLLLPVLEMTTGLNV